jgi:hypothetical protein
MVEAFEQYRTCQLLLNLLLVGMILILHRRTRRMQALMTAHLHSDHEHLQVTEELMQRVADLDGKGLPEVVKRNLEGGT